MVKHALRIVSRAGNPLFTFDSSLFTLHDSRFTIYYLLFTIHDLLFTTYYSLFTIHYSPLQGCLQLTDSTSGIQLRRYRPWSPPQSYSSGSFESRFRLSF